MHCTYNNIVKVAVIGSRTIKKLNIGEYLPKNITKIVSGGAVGVDSLAEKYADEQGIPKQIIHPQYEKYGIRAPLVRNKLILEEADLVIIFWDGKSSGTKHAADYAKKMCKETYIHIIRVGLSQ